MLLAVRQKQCNTKTTAIRQPSWNPTTNKRTWPLVILWFGILLACLIVFIAFFSYDLPLLLFFIVLVLPLVIVGYPIFLVLGAIMFVKGIMKRHIVWVLPVVLICALLVVVFVPLRDIRIQADFALLRPPLEKTVEHFVDDTSYTATDKGHSLLGNGLLYAFHSPDCIGIYFFRGGVLDTEWGYLYTTQPIVTHYKPYFGKEVFDTALGHFFIEMDLGDGWYAITSL
jgi:hypothetical protein